LRATAFQAPGDPRELGVALSAVSTAPADLNRFALQPMRVLYLLALPLLGWLLLVRLGTSPPQALAGGALLAGLVGWAAAFPAAAGYWLPTLGWPWWPTLPLLLLALMPQFAVGYARAWAWLAVRPWVGWLGLGLALAALLLIRLGLPPALGMSGMVIGVWAGLAGLSRSPLSNRSASLPMGSLRAFAFPAVLILALALGLRLIDLGGQPAGLWRDEARHGLQALQIWHDPDYRPIYVVSGADLPALLFYLMAPVVGWFGPELWSVRLVSALAGALTPLALVWATTPLLGRRAALAAAALLAWASWALSMSRWAFPATLDHLLTLSAIGLLWRCLPGVDISNEHSEPPSAPGWLALLGMALAGLFGGLAVYTYHTGRIAPLALAAVAALRLGWAPATWRRALPGLAVALLAGLLTLTPLALYLLNDLEGYNRRVGSVTLLDSLSLETRTPAALLLGNLRRYALAYHGAGDPNGRHHMPDAPLLDPFTGLLLAVGLGLALVPDARCSSTMLRHAAAGARRRPGLNVALSLGVLYLIPGLLSGDAPHAMRALGTLVPACMLAGMALTSLRLAARAWGSGLIVALLLASLSFNVWLYFAVMRYEPGVYREFDLTTTSMGLAARAPWRTDDAELRAVQVYLPQSARLSEPVRFLGWGTPAAAIYSAAPLPAEGAALIILPATATADEQAAALTALGPTGHALGPTAFYPSSTEALTLAFGRGAAATRLVAQLRGAGDE
jgi:4-amino-4-deoxy-L-arabinose transferase-like glycosyltransferase